MREIDKALQAYEERFGERFPAEAMGLASAEEVLAEIQRCLDTGRGGQARLTTPRQTTDTPPNEKASEAIRALFACQEGGRTWTSRNFP